VAVAEDVGAALATAESAQDPYPAYRAVRQAGPCVWSDAIGTWLVGGYEEVRAVLARPDVFRSSGIKGLNVRRLPAEVRAQVPLVETVGLTPALVFSDPPVHTVHRLLVNRALTPRALAPRHGWMHALCDELLGEMAGKDVTDVIGDLALPLSLRMVVELFGADPEDRLLYLELSDAQRAFFTAYAADPSLALATEQVERRFYVHLQQHLERKRARPDESLLSALLAPDGDGKTIGDEEIFLICHIFLTAAFETTAAGVGSAIYGLLTHSDQLALVRDDPSLVPAAFEEGIRWEPPIQKLIRLAETDAEIGGVQVRAGDAVTLYLAAANRDPRAFDNPDVFDISRDARRHIAFGHGIHFCVGAGLGRLEATTAIRALLEHFPAIRLAERWEPAWTRYPQSHMLESLLVATS
jgi:cytochrome P450